MSISLLSQDPVWSDVTPVPQHEAEGALVPIMYAQQYQEGMDYFRAISCVDEHSDRALELTLRIIKLNPAHYTVWQYRFKTLLKLGKSLPDELQLMNELAEDNMKSYQVWHHRLLLLTHLPPPISPSTILAELAFISRSLLPDAKNYHTWAYRQFVLTHFASILTPSDWKDEQTWLDGLLRVDEASMQTEQDANQEAEDADDDEWAEVVGAEDDGDKHKGDVRNNSAWGHRWFLNFGRVGAEEDTDAAIAREIQYTLDQIRLVPNNASSWAYLRGIHDKFSLPYSSQETFAQSVLDACGAKARSCPLAVEWLVEVKEERGDAAGSKKDLELLKTLDPIRSSYWAHRQSILV